MQVLRTHWSIPYSCYKVKRAHPSYLTFTTREEDTHHYKQPAISGGTQDPLWIRYTSCKDTPGTSEHVAKEHEVDVPIGRVPHVCGVAVLGKECGLLAEA